MYLPTMSEDTFLLGAADFVIVFFLTSAKILFGGFVRKDLVLLKICRKYKQTSCMQRFFENTVGHFYCLKMCDKRFMPLNRSNVG